MTQLTETEARLVDAAVAGNVLDLSVGDPVVDDPANASAWGENRRVRGDVVAQLCVGTHGHVHQRGVRVRGADIVGDIDLTDLDVPHPLWLVACRISDGILTAEAASLGSLHLPGTRVATTGPNHGAAVNLEATRIRHILNLSDRYWTPNGTEVAVGSFVAHGEIRLLGASIGGQLAMTGAMLTAGDNGRALKADGATIDGSVFLDDGFVAQGQIRLTGATIGGQLRMSGAKLTADDNGDALNADRATIDHGVYLCGGFVAHGEIRLLGATIGGQLRMSGAKLTAGDNGDALTADGATIDGDVFLDGGFVAHGEIRLRGATIGGELTMSGAKLTAGDNGDALSADGATVDGWVFLGGGFVAHGHIRLMHTKLRYLGLDGDVRGVVDLQHATVESWTIGLIGSDARCGLEGFRYTAIDPTHQGAPPVDKHLELLDLDPGYAPGKFDQLAATYRRAGHELQADQVLVAKQRARRATLPWWRRCLDWLLDATVAYGTQPWRAALMLVGWIMVAWLIYDVVDNNTAMLATTDPAPTFRPLLYAADVTVPVLDFGHRRWWSPDTTWMAIFTATSVVVGWVLSTVTVVGLTGVLGRRD